MKENLTWVEKCNQPNGASDESLRKDVLEYIHKCDGQTMSKSVACYMNNKVVLVDVVMLYRDKGINRLIMIGGGLTGVEEKIITTEKLCKIADLIIK